MVYKPYVITNIDCGNRDMRYESMDAFVKALKRYAKKGYHPFTVHYYLNGYGVAIRKVPNFRSATPGHQAVATLNNGRRFLEYQNRVYEII